MELPHWIFILNFGWQYFEPKMFRIQKIVLKASLSPTWHGACSDRYPITDRVNPSTVYYYVIDIIPENCTVPHCPLPTAVQHLCEPREHHTQGGADSDQVAGPGCWHPWGCTPRTSGAWPGWSGLGTGWPGHCLLSHSTQGKCRAGSARRRILLGLVEPGTFRAEILAQWNI